MCRNQKILLRCFLFMLLVGTGYLPLFAQNKGLVKGRIVDQQGPLTFSSIFLTTPTDTTTIVAAVLTDAQGKFVLQNVAPGDYTLNIRMIGYKKKQIPVTITAGSPPIDLNPITLQSDSVQLASIEVTTTRELIQKTEEGFVVEAADNITQIGGTAADLLKNIPGVSVTSEGELTIRGKTPLTLINGRVSGVVGADRAAQLERIPASSIERIEIINNPSARYDADAESGIINIVLKKNEEAGTNGAFAVGVGRGDRYRLNTSLLISRRSNRWNIGLDYDNWYTTRTRRIKGDRVNYDIPGNYFLTQRRSDERLIFYQTAKATLDYTPNKYNSLAFEAIGTFPGEDNRETLRNTYRSADQDFTTRNQRFSKEIRRSPGLEAALTYTRRFANPDQLLSVNLTNSFGNEREHTDIDTKDLTEQDDPLGTRLQRTHTYQKTNLSNIALDYTVPLPAKGVIETGYKAIIRILNADFQRSNFVDPSYIVDPQNSNLFDFHEQIHALYTQYTSWIGSKEAPRWKYTLGLRAEQVWNNASTRIGADDFTNHYFNLYPSANVLYYTPSGNNVKLSYSRRINRPGLGQLNPFTDITDSLNQRSGSPRLQPERIHSIDLAYTHTLQDASLTLSTFYRHRTDAILSYSVLNESGVALTKPLNFGNASTYGLEAIATYNPAPFWSINFSVSAYEQTIASSAVGAEVSRNQVSWYAKLIQNVSVAQDCKLQIAANYTSPVGIPQGKTVAIYNIDLGLQQKIMKGKGRLGLAITDIFNTQKYGQITSDYNFYFSRISKLDTRAVMLTFGYTFGTSFKEKLMENKFLND